MSSADRPRRIASSVFLRSGLVAAGLLVFGLLSACTTVEGTNALVDATTFEREVANETLRGIGIIPREEKPEVTTPRAPLVLPRDGNALPPPAEASPDRIPVDSDSVQIDTTGLTEADLKLLRNAKVVDLHTVSGRPLTEAETRALTARMTAYRTSTAARPLYLPPEKYFTVVNGQDLICLAANGDLVSLDDAACPPEIRAALQES